MEQNPTKYSSLKNVIVKFGLFSCREIIAWYNAKGPGHNSIVVFVF
jgi:hypothetical protein